MAVHNLRFRHQRRINMLMCDQRTVAPDEQSYILSLMDPGTASF
jgi:prepilin-type processing-associated H-X9-DG protein